MDLTGTTALVTGANGGIGSALLERLAREPIGVLLAGVRDPDAFEPAIPPAGGAREVRAVRMDLSSRESIDASCDELAELSAIDLLVNNAGRLSVGQLEAQQIDAVYAMFQVNLVAVAHLTQRVLPGMLGRGSGKIVNNASISGYAWFPAATTYAASKAGVVAFTESLRRELRGTGVTTLELITPGVDTPMLDATEDAYGRHMDTSAWNRIAPSEWADRVVEAIASDSHVLDPSDRTRLAKVVAHGPAKLLDLVAARSFTRRPRG